MRKHNTKFAQRWSREAGDRSNFPQTMAHSFVKDKLGQVMANSLLCSLMARAGVQGFYSDAGRGAA